MAKVLIDTDSVLNVSKGMDTLSGNVDTVLGSVKSYDVANSDFDFSGAKAAIVNNIEGIETKVSNTNILLDTVVKVHSELQEAAGNLNSTDAVTSANTSASAVSSSSSDSYSSDYSSYSGANYYSYSDDSSDQGGMGGFSSSSYQPYYEAAATKDKTTEVANAIASATAIEKIDEKETDAEVSKKVVSSIVEEMYKEVLEETKIEETTISNLLNTIKNGEMCIVVEGNSLDLKTVEYLKVVAKAAMPVQALIRFVKLDNILDFKTNSTASDVAEDTKTVLNEDKDKQEKTEEKQEKDNKVESLNYSVKDKALLDSLSSIKCAKGIEISYEQLPITLIIKNNTVLSFKRGIISEEELRKELLRINVIPTVNQN